MENSILIIDDDKELVAELTDILVDEGYSVYSAYDGITGLNMFESNKPLLVILDMKIPGVTGIELISIFKTMQPQIPVIMISGRPIYSPLCKQDKIEHIQEEKILRLANQFINKPFNVEFLIKCIKEHINNSTS
ncbi:MAG: hypothetical protein A2Y40_00255 [Candidatus Margulisbacteria bacterium GWF2_35_9]|nr:MAG: hypothetical protein A2Y40_00255 [Candidatus Margulisbacteria bacterium GWF2_35_9]